MDQYTVEQLYNEYASSVFSFVYRITYDENVSEDIVQDVFEAISKTLSQFREESKIKTWIFSIAKNKAYHEIKNKKKNLKKIEKLRIEQNASKSGIDISVLLNSNQLEEVKNGCLYALINCLPFFQRTAFILHLLDDFSIEETAKILNKSPNSIRILIARARKTVKAFLCDHCEYISERPTCYCLNMASFAFRNDFIHEKIENYMSQGLLNVDKARDEIELLKTLPKVEIPKNMMK